MIGSPHFQCYTKNLNRLALIELIDNLYTTKRRQNVRASIVVNPFTNIPYDVSDENERDEASSLKAARPATV